MTLYSPSFNIEQYETREEINPFVTPSQQSEITDVTLRVPAQLDWIAQLLGWNGKNYWSSLASTVDQKRQLQGGTFGVYNSYIYPEIQEIRNWEGSVIVKYDPYLQENQEFILGDYTYVASSVVKDGDKIVLNFGTLSEQFLSDIADNKQLKAICHDAMPAPFRRPRVGISADFSFNCEIDGSDLILYPRYDNNNTLPFVYNSFFAGSRYYFNLPVVLYLTNTVLVTPTYSFDTSDWYIDIPCNLPEVNSGITAKLDYQGSFLIVSILNWQDPSDWVEKKTLQYFAGVWSNKGGYLPFHFTFDALSLHGYDAKKSLYLGAVSREIGFDTLLNFVYQQTTEINPLPPPVKEKAQVWWNSQTGKFLVHTDDLFNCGPWVSCEYPQGLQEGVLSDFVFPDVLAFGSYSGDFPAGSVVTIVDGSGIGPLFNILGVTQVLTGPFQITILKPTADNEWVPIEFVYADEADFNSDALLLPSQTLVKVTDASGISSGGLNYSIANLSITITDPYGINLMKSDQTGVWYLKPPSDLKYIGDTRLFASSLDYSNPVDGEMYWDFSVSNPNLRTASIFYYNHWVYNGISMEWELKGDWVNINTGALTSPPPQVVNFSEILVYCNGNLLTIGESFIESDFQIQYSVNSLTGTFEFLYNPMSYDGSVNFPTITVSDSLTTSFTRDITNLVFSGLTYYASPNIEDSETLLRLWKTTPLFCINDARENTTLSYPNGLVADNNSGPADIHWERYFIRLPPTYQRDGEEWQKVNLVAQDFGYWGSPALPEDMSCPEGNDRPSVYDEVFLNNGEANNPTYIYSEPYLYSAAVPEFESGEDFDNSSIAPAFDNPYDQFDEGQVIPYQPLHERRADTSSLPGRGYGEWEGAYYRISDCSGLTGHLINDIYNESIELISPPIWDASIYKAPQTCLLDQGSGEVDANHFKVGYAFFCADLSAAEEAVFNFG